MPIPLSFEIKPTAKTVRIENILKNNNREQVAWWYCGIKKNHVAESQPGVLVGFRDRQGGLLSDSVTLECVPLTALGQISVGTIWKNNICRSRIELATYEGNVDFRSDGWRFSSFEVAAKNGTELPYPRNIHPLQYVKDKNWLIEFKLPTGGKLVVPCLEFFSRCYGRSQEINRILATYDWTGSEGSCQSRFYAPLDEPEEDDRWKVKLRRRLRNGDTTFLAHAKYDRHTERVAKSIYAQIEESFTPESTAPQFIKVEPWFRGPAEIRAKGIWFDNNRSFLALQIIGCSDPDGILIERERENTNKREGGGPKVDGCEAWAGVPESRLVRPPDVVDLTGDDEPDHDAGSVEILDEDFVVLGIPRAIVDRHGEKITSSLGAKRIRKNASAYSSGEPHGSGKGVGYASIHAKPVMESHGVLADMWNALLHAKRKYPNRIKTVEWFTFADGYKATIRPNLIALEPIYKDDEPDIPTATKNWVFQDVATGRMRGVMVVRVVVDGASVHIIELERRPRIKRGADGQQDNGEESYQGFVIALEGDTQFNRWLKRFLSDIRYIRGIVQKLVVLSPGRANTFAHSRADHQEVVGEAAVLNAFGKIGIKL
jgi:hypothetical protein